MKKLTFNFLMPALACTLIFTSCGNKKEASGDAAATDSTKTETPAVAEEPTVDFATACTMENKMAVTVKGYEYDTDNKKAINFDIADFVVKNSTWNLTTDSTAELSLFNYTAEEATPKQKNDQVEIRVKFIARKGKKIGPGVSSLINMAITINNGRQSISSIPAPKKSMRGLIILLYKFPPN